MNWLHFVGEKYYTMKSFKEEAYKYGVTRRISMQNLKKMNFGDIVYLAMMKGKSPVIFGFFVVDGISGLNPEVVSSVDRELIPINMGGRQVQRGCGSYTEGPSFTARSASVNDVVRAVEASSQKCKPMVSGQFHAVEELRLKKVPFQQGFRMFDAEKAFRDGGGTGQYYIHKNDEDEHRMDALLQEVKDYLKKV